MNIVNGINLFSSRSRLKGILNANRFDQTSGVLVYKETVSPKDFIYIVDSHKDNIISARILPPTPGCNNFGFIEVKYRNPIRVPLRKC